MRVGEVAECYEKHAEALIRLAASLVGPSDADDVVSAAVVGVLASKTDDVADLRAYLYRAVVNSARKHWRTLDRRMRREALHPTSDNQPADEQFAEVVSALVRLSAQQRAVIHLTYWEDLTPQMVATRLGVGDGTVRRQLARARRRLAEVLDEQ